MLFLWTSKSTGITHVLGMSQGIFSVAPQPDGSVQLSRARIGETMHDASGNLVRDQAVQMNLSDLRARVSPTISNRGRQMRIRILALLAAVGLLATAPATAYYYFVHYLATGNAPERFDLTALPYEDGDLPCFGERAHGLFLQPTL